MAAADTAASPGATLDLLGCRVVIAADDAEVLDGLLSVYASIPAGPAVSRRLDARLVRTGAASADLELPGWTVGGRGEDAAAAGAAVAFALFHAVAALVTEALVIHAGAVDLGRGAVLLVAPSRTGKTTLSTALAVRGAAFLSDEAAPIGREDARVRPFPRAVGLRPGPLRDWKALERAFEGAHHVLERGGRGKHIVDLVASGVARAGAAAPVRDLVFLLPSRAPWSSAARGRWILELDARNPGFAARLRALPGVRQVEDLGEDLEPALRLVLDPSARIASDIDELAEAEGCTVVRALEEFPPPDHEALPEMRRLSAAEGVFRLTRFLENGVRSELFRQELGGRAGRLVVELAGLVGEARHWELTPGDLDARCRLVEGLA